MSKKQKQDLIILSIITLVLICVNILILLNKLMLPTLNNKQVQEQYSQLIQKEQEELDERQQIKTQEQIEQEELEALKSMGEKDRMQFYLSKYISYIETKEYEKAYNLLYEEYKNNYFATYQEYEEYVIEKYPDLMGIEYLGLQRQGQYYVYEVQITDMINTQEQTAITQKFVIYEKNFNDFVLSFQK